MKRLVWLSVLWAVAGCGGTKPTPAPDPYAESRPTAVPTKGKQVALPE
jgi:hypothetical protein